MAKERKGDNQKQKMLYLVKIFSEETDDHHYLTMPQIIEKLAGYGVNADRKTLYQDFGELKRFGFDILSFKENRNFYYYLGSREFELAELKLLVDAIQSSKFITHSKSLKLIAKLEKLVSENDGKQLHREVYVTNRVKTLNEQIYYNVDELHNAISDNRMITFKYMKWAVNFGGRQKIIRTERHPGKLYCVSPFALCWDDENYYLVAYDSAEDKIKHFRVDKMEKICVTDKEREGLDKLDGFNLAKYAKSVFSMFGGEECEVKLSVDNDLIGVIVDRFGAETYIIRESDTSFIVSVRVVLSPQFFAWIFGLGTKVRILSPKRAIDEYKAKIQELTALYQS